MSLASKKKQLFFFPVYMLSIKTTIGQNHTKCLLHQVTKKLSKHLHVPITTFKTKSFRLFGTLQRVFLYVTAAGFDLNIVSLLPLKTDSVLILDVT